MSDRSLLANLPMDLRPSVLDYVGRRMYPSLSIDIDGSRSYTVCIHGDSFKVDQEGLEVQSFFVPDRHHLLGILHRLVNARVGVSTGFEESEFSFATMGYITAKSTIYSVESATSGRSHTEQAFLTSLEHMINLLGVIYIIL
jgi:hypothetical protein